MKHNPKDIDIQGIRHAKEVICSLLDIQNELLEALEECANRLSSFGLMEFVAKEIDPLIKKVKA